MPPCEVYSVHKFIFIQCSIESKFFSLVYIYAAPFLFFAPYMFHPTYTSFLVVVVIISLSANIDINKSNQSGWSSYTPRK